MTHFPQRNASASFVVLRTGAGLLFLWEMGVSQLVEAGLVLLPATTQLEDPEYLLLHLPVLNF